MRVKLQYLTEEVKRCLVRVIGKVVKPRVREIGIPLHNCYYPLFMCLFQLFRRDLNEVKVVYISNNYYLVCHFVIFDSLNE